MTHLIVTILDANQQVNNGKFPNQIRTAIFYDLFHTPGVNSETALPKNPR